MSDREPTAGDRIGRYELVAPLGRGGMGQVWEAVLHGPRGFRKPVALKLARTSVADPTRRETLVVEARLGARLHHVNLVSTLELGQHEDGWFVAMELVSGVSASALRAAGPLAAEAVVEIGVQACAGLAQLHALDLTTTVETPPMPLPAPPRGTPAPDDTASGDIAATWMAEGPAREPTGAGWVHRDIKPSNLLIDRTGVVKVADLGVARLAGEVGRAAGTAGYMPPEQQTGHEDARADLFALGVTLLELATGAPPFGRGAAGMRAVHELDVRLPELVRAAESALPGLGEVLGRCLQPDPGHRPPSASALADALAQLAPPRARTAALLQAVGGASGPAPSAVPGSGTPRLPAQVPAARDRFFGREDDAASLRAALAEGKRLVTLVGLGGVGKTRLAREVAASLHDAWAGGVWWLDLTNVASPSDLVATMARSLSVRLVAGNPEEQVAKCLQSHGRALIVLDNVEQAKTTVVERLTAWLDHSAVSILATSRSALRARGEHVVRIGALGRDAAISLFVERAPREVDPSHLVAELVEELDALPLAIELAAARARVLSVPQLRERLHQGLRLLSGGTADVPERHRSLEACLATSFDALSATARRALGQLTVFVGGFTLEAAEHTLALGVGAPWPVDVVQELVDAQLLEFESPSRFRILSMIEQFVRARTEASVRATAEERHGAWFATFGTPAALEALRGPGGEARAAGLAHEIGNLTAARRRALVRGDASTAAACACAAWEVHRVRGPFRAAAEGLEAALEKSEDADRVRLMLAAGSARDLAGDPDRARALWESGLARARETGDRGSEGDILVRLGALLRIAGRLDEARARAEAALTLFRELGDGVREADALLERGLQELQQNRETRASALLTDAIARFRDQGVPHRAHRAVGHLAGTLVRAGRTAEARHQLEAAIVAARSVGDVRAEGLAMGQLAEVWRVEGRLAEARRHIDDALALNRRIGARRMEGMLLGNLAGIDKAEGRFAEALVNHQAALVVHREVGNLKSEAIVLCNRGSLLTRLGRLEEAEESLDRAMALHEVVGSRRYLGNVVGNLGSVRLDQGRLDEAKDRFDEALAIAREVGDRRQEGLLLGQCAELHRRRGDLERADESLDGAIDALTDFGSPLELAMVLGDRVELELARGGLEEAREALAAALALADDHDAPAGSDLVIRLTELGRRLSPPA